MPVKSTPEALGISSSSILAFIEAAEQRLESLHSFMILRHGKTAAEGWWAPYSAQKKHTLFSLSKSFTSTAVGMAVSEGLLTLEDRVVTYFPEDVPAEISPHLAAMHIRDLLSMSTGHAEDTLEKVVTAQDGNWAKAFLAQPVVYAPGTHFLYNTGTTYMLSAIVQKVSGMRLIDYLEPRLFKPLGIRGAWWETCPRGINTGGFGLSIRTRDIACFGQLFLQKGIWKGRRLIPAEWVEQATAVQISNGDDPNNDWAQGYGFQFWRCRNNAFRGDGAFGQFCIVMPEQDVVIAMTAGLPDMQAVLNLVWEFLLPGIQAEPLPANEPVCQMLAARLEGLKIHPRAVGEDRSPQAGEWSGKTYTLDANPGGWKTVCFDFNEGETVVTIRDAHKLHRIALGQKNWILSRTRVVPNLPSSLAASGVWKSVNEFEMDLLFYESHSRQTLTCQFSKNCVELNLRYNVNFGPLEIPAVKGYFI